VNWRKAIEALVVELMSKTRFSMTEIEVAYVHGKTDEDCLPSEADVLNYEGLGSYTSRRAHTHRIALAIHVQDAESTYRPSATSSGARIVPPYDDLCRRNSNEDLEYSDPQIFPKLWSSSISGQTYD
jgi:hypothetical protein